MSRNPQLGTNSAGEKTSATLTLQCAEDIPSLPASKKQLRQWIEAAVASATDAISPPMELTLRFVGTSEMQYLNHTYRQRDYPTNVLTFSYPLPTGTPSRAMADIVICLPVVQNESNEQGKPFLDHLAHLIVHGVLHAYGFDHENPQDATKMEQTEIAILSALGVPNPYSP